MDVIHRVLGAFAGYRTLHADGRFYRGSFRANEQARRLSRAVHFQGDLIPATVRFSKGGVDPFAPFSATVGMATRFYLADGGVTNLVMLSQKLFIARSIEEFMDILHAAMPLEPGGKPNMAGLTTYLATNPRVAAVLKMRSESLAPTSFATTGFHAVHAFRLLDAGNRSTDVRFHWVPVAGVEGQSLETLQHADHEVLFGELETRLESEPVAFDLQVEVAEAGDPLNDATTLWPPDRRRMVIGRLELVAPVTEAEIGDPLMNHDPTKLVDGIEPSDDPILQIRRGVYEVSAARRSNGWKSCPFAQHYG